MFTIDLLRIILKCAKYHFLNRFDGWRTGTRVFQGRAHVS